MVALRVYRTASTAACGRGSFGCYMATGSGRGRAITGDLLPAPTPRPFPRPLVPRDRFERPRAGGDLLVSIDRSAFGDWELASESPNRRPACASPRRLYVRFSLVCCPVPVAYRGPTGSGGYAVIYSQRETGQPLRVESISCCLKSKNTIISS